MYRAFIFRDTAKTATVLFHAALSKTAHSPLVFFPPLFASAKVKIGSFLIYPRSGVRVWWALEQSVDVLKDHHHILHALSPCQIFFEAPHRRKGRYRMKAKRKKRTHVMGWKRERCTLLSAMLTDKYGKPSSFI